MDSKKRTAGGWASGDVTVFRLPPWRFSFNNFKQYKDTRAVPRHGCRFPRHGCHGLARELKTRESIRLFIFLFALRGFETGVITEKSCQSSNLLLVHHVDTHGNSIQEVCLDAGQRTPRKSRQCCAGVLFAVAKLAPRAVERWRHEKRPPAAE